MECCTKMMDELDKRGCDFTLLFWLRRPSAIRGSELGRQLSNFLLSFDMNLGQFEPSRQNVAFLRAFFGALKERFEERGVCAVNPRNFLIGMNRGGKKDVLERYAKVKWPQPRQPYCMQTMGGGDVLFIICQTWQDGLCLQREILRMRGYTHQSKFIPVEQVLEHQWGESPVVRLMIDWEIMASSYEGRVSIEEIQKVPDSFPEWFVGRLRSLGAISSKTRVECVVKNKTRWKGLDLKLSRHFTFNICGVTMSSHYHVLQAVLVPWEEKIKQLHKDKNMSSISQQDLLHPVWGWDNRLLRGQNGIGTLYCRKADDPGAPFPKLEKRMIFGDSLEIKGFSWGDKEVSVDDEDSLVTLYRYCLIVYFY